MEINYELTQQDFLEYQKIVARQNTAMMTAGQMLGVISGFLIIADFIYCVATGMFDFSNGNILTYLFGRFVLLIALLLSSAFLLNMYAKKAIDKATNVVGENGVFCEHKIILNENEFIEITDVNTSRHSWVGVGEITENEKFVVIPLNLSSSFTIPKRYFQNEESAKMFVDTANEYRKNADLKFNPSHFSRFEIES
jgi:uncharacterized membrane protein